MKKCLIFDTDLGIDDSFAYLIWSIADIEPDYIVSTPGNATLEGIKLSSRLLKKITGVKSKTVLNNRPVVFPNPEEKASFHGKDGLGNIAEKVAAEWRLEPEKAKDFVEFDVMLDDLKSYDEITYICVGPLSALNIVLSDTEICKKLKNVYILGGGFHEFNCSNETEFNFSKYPLGVYGVLKSNAPITLFPIDFTNHRIISEDDIRSFEKISECEMLSELLRYNLKSNSIYNHIDGAVLHDAFTVLYTLYPEKFSKEKRKIASNEYGHIFECNDGKEVTVITDCEKDLLKLAVEKLYRKYSCQNTQNK